MHVSHSYGRRSAMSYTADGGDGETRLTDSSGPLPYKRCTDIPNVPLAVGSLLKFRLAGYMDIGTFQIQSLPTHGSMLLLAIRRHDTWSTSADFTSHIFADVPEPQIALVDAYLGKAKSMLEVRDSTSGLDRLADTTAHNQEVHFGSVVDVAPGDYEWRLMGSKSQKASVEFMAEDRKTYTVLRVGAEAVGGASYPEELIVWPNDGVVVHHGADEQTRRGLFGIPTRLGRSRSHAASQMMISLPVVIALLSGIASVCF